MSLNVYKARQIASMSLDEVRMIPLKHIIEFDDGDRLEAWQNETIYTYLFWGVFAPYPNVKIAKKHHLQVVLKGEELDTSSHLKLCSAILESIVIEANLFYPEQKEPVLEAIYRAISDAMGWLSILTEADVVSIDILDFVAIARHPKILALKDAAMADPKRIKYVYDEAIKIISNEPEFLENGLAKAVRSKMVKANQVVQCVCFRGFSTEVDGTIFPKPVWGNYTQGNREFYDFVADSRLAAKSHFYSDTALKDSEYTARRFQLFAMLLERIDYTDCGSDNHKPWLIKGPEHDADGTTTYPGDLPFLIGKYYIEDEEYQKVKPLKVAPAYKCIEGNEKYLIGKMIHIRTILGCKSTDKHAACHVCVGKLSQNISRFSNLGHLGSVTTTKEFTQNILSIKHVNTSSMVLKVLIGEHERVFMNTGPEGTAYFINESLKPLEPTLTMLRDQVPGLIDLMAIEDIEQIGLPRISAVTTMVISVRSDPKFGMRREVSLNTEQKGKPSILSREFLAHLKHASWEVDERNNFVFNLADWDFKKPVLVMANKEESFVDLANQANVVVQGSQKVIKIRHQENAAYILLEDVFYLVNSKLRVNIVGFEMFIYPLMVASKTSYALARGTNSQYLGVAELLTKFRDLGPALAYEDQGEALINPASFFLGSKPDSPMDVFLAPREVVAAEQRRQAREIQHPY